MNLANDFHWELLSRKEAWLPHLNAAQKSISADVKGGVFSLLTISVLRHTSYCKSPHFTPEMGSRNSQSALALGYL